MLDKTNDVNGATEEQKKRGREVSRYAFPYYDLDTATEVARVLHDRAGGKASMVQVASFLGHKDEYSGAFRAKLWAAKLFGLVNIEGANVMITPLGEQLASLRSGLQRDRRLAEAFLNVPLFSEVYRKYENSTLPATREGLKRALETTFGVSSKRVSVALKTLEASAEQAAFKREDSNRLIHPIPIGLIEATTSETKQKESSVPVSQFRKAREEETYNEIHPAILGFLRELPSQGKLWSDGSRQRWLDAFTAIIKALYPTETENQNDKD